MLCCCHPILVAFKVKAKNLLEMLGKLDLKVNSTKTKSLRINCSTTEPIILNRMATEDVAEFTCLGTKVTLDGAPEVEVKARISKARGAFASLNSIWKSSNISLKRKFCIFRSNVRNVLLYTAESWKVTKSICQKLEVFQNKCLRRILGIYWQNKILN